LKILFLLILLSLFSTQVYAYHFCRGQIKTVWIEGDGDVYIVGTWRNKHTQICNVSSAWKGVNVESCKTWVSLTQLAYAAKSDVLVRYHDDAISSCTEVPEYGSAPAPNYVMVTEFDD